MNARPEQAPRKAAWRRLPAETPAGSQHPERLHVGLQDGLLLHALVRILLAQTDNGAQRLDVVAVALAFGIDVANVVRDRLFLFFQPLDALDDGLELVLGKSRCGLFLDGGRRGGHRALLNRY